MTAQLLRFPQERVSDAGTHEARILMFPKRERLEFRFNGLWWEWVWE
jgi:hypothetical protein